MKRAVCRYCLQYFDESEKAGSEKGCALVQWDFESVKCGEVPRLLHKKSRISRTIGTSAILKRLRIGNTAVWIVNSSLLAISGQLFVV